MAVERVKWNGDSKGVVYLEGKQLFWLLCLLIDQLELYILPWLEYSVHISETILSEFYIFLDILKLLIYCCVSPTEL